MNVETASGLFQVFTVFYIVIADAIYHFCGSEREQSFSVTVKKLLLLDFTLAHYLAIRPTLLDIFTSKSHFL